MVEQDLSMYVTYNPCSVTEETTLDEMLRRLNDYGFHQWPVVDADRQLVGMLDGTAIVDAATSLGSPQTRSQSRSGSRSISTFGPSSAVTAARTVVRDLMEQSTFGVTLQNFPRTVLKLLLENELHSLPVLEEGRLIGLVTSTDFLREFSYGDLPAFRESIEAYVEPCSDWVEIDSTLPETMELFESMQVNALPVMRGGFPLGVVSRRDIRRARCQSAAADAIKGGVSGHRKQVLEIAKSCPSLRPSQSLGDAACLMLEASVEALPVVNQARRLLGVVTEPQILRRMLSSM